MDKSNKDYTHHQLEALWIYQTNNVVELDLLKKLLGSDDHRARAAATRVLCFWHKRIPDSLAMVRKCVNDKHPRVRLEAVRALSYFESEDAAEAALDVLNHDMDDYLQYTLDETMRQLEN